MRFAERCMACVVPLTVALTAGTLVSGSSPAPIHRTRYAMGTMFDIVAYHQPREQAEAAMSRALDEIVRLDGVLSHFHATSDLSRLMRDGHRQVVAVDSSLYEVLEASIGFSRKSEGRFDVTIGPLLNAWKRAHADGRSPSTSEIADAKRCVGFDKIVLIAPDRVRLTSDCMAIDLGGIGKGYAVDRALQILRAAGIRRGLINAGGSSVSALGSPPQSSGWPVQVGPHDFRVRLADAALSTSQQVLRSHVSAPGTFAEILDPHSGAPIERATSVSVVATNGTDADALSTTLVLVPIEHGRRILAQFPNVSAVWLDGAGAVAASYGTAFSGIAAH
jgi:FAD:protein FMN transferase